MADPAHQYPLDLGHRTALGREDFLIAPSNEDAVAWIDLWPEWPAPSLILYGPVASGKSHIAAVWGERAQAVCVKPETLNETSARELAENYKHIILDDADHLIGNIAGEKGLFHLYNIFKEERRTFLMTLQDPPVRRQFALPDLASRLRAAPTVAIREPDDMLLSALLVKLFSDRQLRVNHDVLSYIVPRIERSFEAARDLVDRADRQAMSEKRAISIPLIRSLLTND